MCVFVHVCGCVELCVIVNRISGRETRIATGAKVNCTNPQQIARQPKVLFGVHYLHNRWERWLKSSTYVNSRPFHFSSVVRSRSVPHVRELASDHVVLRMLVRESHISAINISLRTLARTHVRLCSPHVIVGNVAKRTPRSRHPHNRWQENPIFVLFT